MKVILTKEEFKEYQEALKKAKSWDDLGRKIAECYIDEDGNDLSEDDQKDLGHIGEVAAIAFGWL